MYQIIKKYIIDNYISDYSILLDLIKSTVGIKKREIKSVSKFGGIPLLPKKFNLDKYIDKSLSFFCQIYIDDFQSVDEYNYLKQGRILYFFIKPNLGYPIKKEDFKIFSLVYNKNFIDYKYESPMQFGEMFVKYFSHYNFPSYQSYERLELEKDDFELDNKIEDIQEFINSHNEITSGCEGGQLFGNPQAIQGTVSFHWAIKYLGLEYHQFTDDELKRIKKEEKNFVLLLQVDMSDLTFTKQFGEGVFYFGIKKQDLIENNFDNVELVYQST